MKEDQKKSSKMIDSGTRKNIQLPSPNQVSIHSEFYKQNKNVGVRKQIILNKHMRRIGCKSLLRAYRTTIDESTLKSLDYNNQTQIGEARTKENRKQKQQQNKRKLKRIGHKKIIHAYKEMISEMEKNQSGKKIQEQSQNRISLCVPIKIEQIPQEEQRHSLFQNVILEQFQDKSSKKSLIRQSQIENQMPLVDSIVIRKIISEDNGNVNGDSFSININMVSNGTDHASKDMKMENSSIYEKSDGCLESFNTQSEHRVSQSVIIHGSFQRLIDQSEINSNAQIDQDQGQMKQLVEQINKNLQFNDKRQQQSKQLIQKLQQTHLVVPVNKKIDQRTSINKKIQQKSQEEQQKIKNKQKIKSVHQPTKQRNEEFEKTQQQKLLQIIEQKYNKNKKANPKRNSKKSTLVKRNSQQKRSSQYNPKQIKTDKKSPRARKSKQMNDKLIDKDMIIQEKENKENKNHLNENKLKKPLPQPYPQRENLQKSFNNQKDDFIMKSNISLLLAPVQLSMSDKTQKKFIQTKESKANSNHIFASMHEKGEKDWINGKSNKKIYKKEQDYQNSPSNSQNKRSNHKFELNKCVNEARKLLTSSVHI